MSGSSSAAAATQGGRFAGYYGNDFIGALAKGRITACVAWSGDVLQAQFHNPYLKFVVPEEGLMIWADNLLVPKASTKGNDVARLLNYYYSPKVAAKVAEELLVAAGFTVVAHELTADGTAEVAATLGAAST